MSIKLQELLDIPQCSKTLSDFAKVLGINASVLDADGIVLFPKPPVYNCILRDYISKDYSSNCRNYEQKIIKKVAMSKSFVKSTCWCGATTLISPIIVQNKIIGFIKAEKFITKKPTHTDIDILTQSNGLDPDFLLSSLEKLPIIPENHLVYLNAVLTGFADQISNNGLKQRLLQDDVKLQKSKLKTNFDKLELALNVLQFGIYEFDIESRTIYFNKHSVNILGVPQNADGSFPPLTIDKFCASYVPPNKTEEIAKIIEEAITSDSIQHSIFQAIKANGDLCWIEIDLYCITDDDTGRKKLVGLYRDVTDRNNKELRISRQNHSLQKITLNQEISSGNLDRGFKEIASNAANTLDVDNVCFWLYDDSSDYLTGYQPLKNIDRNKITRRLNLATTLEVLGGIGNHINFYCAEDVKSDPITAKYYETFFKPNHIRSFLCAGLIVNREFKGIIACEMESKPRKWFQEEQDYVISLAHITSSAFEIKYRIRAQEELSESQRLAHVCHFSWDIAKDIVHGSEEFYRIFELHPDSSRSIDSILKAIHPDDRESAEAAFFTQDLPSSLQSNDEARLLLPDGRIKYISLKLRYLLDDSKHLNRIIGIIQDITTVKESEFKLIEARAQAEAANKSKSDFLANMSHEIRTPLNIVIGMIDLSLDTAMTPTQSNYLSKASAAAKSLLGIINDILDFSKVEAGKLMIERIPFNIKEIAENVISNVSIALENPQFELILDLDAKIPKSVFGDPLRTTQIITNLLSNATKFTHKGEVILKISITRHTASLVGLHFSVADTGIGMTSEQQAKLFKSFNQADASITRKHGGTGLGLAISKQLLNLMGGNFELTSEQGVGSNFSFELNFDIDEEEDKEAYQIPRKMQHTRILVIDNNRSFLRILSGQLDYFGFKTDIASSSKNGLAMLDDAFEQNKGYKLIILSWNLADINSEELIRTIQNRGYSQPPKIIITISCSTEETLTAIEKLGIHRVIVKPLIPSILLSSLLEAIDKQGHKYKTSTVKTRVLPDFSGNNILLVEDNQLNQEIAVNLLNKTKATTYLANNGLEAVGMVRKSTYDLILMDIQMPIMDGLSATRAIRKFDHKTPIIAMTAHALSGDKDKSLSAGMNEHITKPFDPKMLYSILEHYLSPTLGHPQLTAQSTATTASGNEEPESLRAKDYTPPPTLAPTTTQEPDTHTKLSPLEADEEVERTIDSAAAIELLGNDPKLYKEVLRMFLSDYSTTTTDILEYYTQGRLEDAHRIAHTFKGIAGNIGAPRLKAIATRLDLKFKAGETELKTDIEEFCEEVQQTMNLITELRLQE